MFSDEKLEQYFSEEDLHSMMVRTSFFFFQKVLENVDHLGLARFYEIRPYAMLEVRVGYIACSFPHMNRRVFEILKPKIDHRHVRMVYFSCEFCHAATNETSPFLNRFLTVRTRYAVFSRAAWNRKKNIQSKQEMTTYFLQDLMSSSV